MNETMIAAPYLYRYRQKIPRTHTQTAPKAGSDDEQGVKGSEASMGGLFTGSILLAQSPILTLVREKVTQTL